MKNLDELLYFFWIFAIIFGFFLFISNNSFSPSGMVIKNMTLRIVNGSPYFINLTNLTYYVNETINLTRDVIAKDPDNDPIIRYYFPPFDNNGVYKPVNITGTKRINTTIIVSDGGTNISATIYITIINTTPIYPISVYLRRPYDNELLILDKSNQVAFLYDILNQSPIKRCSLYIKELFATTIIPWQKVFSETNISDKTNVFIMDNLLRGRYVWNVECEDIKNRTNMSSENSSFSVNYISSLSTSIISDEKINQIYQGYDFDLIVPDLTINEGETRLINLSINNKLDPITSVEIATNSTNLRLLKKYFKIIQDMQIIPAVLDASDLKAGKYPVKIRVDSITKSMEKIVFINVVKSPELEYTQSYVLKLIKTLIVKNDEAVVKILIINDNPVNFTDVEINDFLGSNSLKLLNFGHYDKKNNSVMFSISELGAFSNLSLSYKINVVDLKNVSLPIVNKPADIRLEMKYIKEQQTIKRENDKMFIILTIIFILLFLSLILLILKKKSNQDKDKEKAKK